MTVGGCENEYFSVSLKNNIRKTLITKKIITKTINNEKL